MNESQENYIILQFIVSTIVLDMYVLKSEVRKCY